MKYNEITIYAGKADIDEITGILLVHGITDSVVNDPDLVAKMEKDKKDYEWDYVDEAVFKNQPRRGSVVFYLNTDDDGEARLAEIRDAFSVYDAEISVVTVDDEDWKNKYKEHFKMLKLSDRLAVRPSWDDTPADPGMTVIDLDPGMAFGTGGHATTAMCAELMDREGCAGKKVLDVGTGSGILAIAAAMLGADDVLGIDIDDEAVTAARENVAKNNCADVVTIMKGDLTKGVEYKADIIAANLMAELIVSFAPYAKQHLCTGAAFITSGILTEKKDMVIEALEKEDIKIEKVLTRGEWCAVLGRNN
ncbi:MAG: 50S ribosomal protein L11 methyltransferase [Eubacteriaceae bacterium]|jgi:ribosomal protein L11 methyltransferase|nr:50S ribosomal protein L11 methyltransferase [Eubacteriaceae bacterium]